MDPSIMFVSVGYATKKQNTRKKIKKKEWFMLMLGERRRQRNGTRNRSELDRKLQRRL